MSSQYRQRERSPPRGQRGVSFEGVPSESGSVTYSTSDLEAPRQRQHRTPPYQEHRQHQQPASFYPMNHSSGYPYWYSNPQMGHYNYPASYNYPGHGSTGMYHPQYTQSSSYYQAPPASRHPFTQSPQDAPGSDIERIRLEAAFRARREKELESRIRQDVEEEFRRQLEVAKRAQEQSRQEIENVRVEVERATRAKLLAERSAEAERERLAAQQARRFEKELRAKIEAERLAEEAAKEARERQREEFEKVIREKMLQNLEELTDMAKGKLMADLGMGKEAAQMPQNMGVDNVQTCGSTIEESGVWQQTSYAGSSITKIPSDIGGRLQIEVQKNTSTYSGIWRGKGHLTVSLLGRRRPRTHQKFQELVPEVIAIPEASVVAEVAAAIGITPCQLRSWPSKSLSKSLIASSAVSPVAHPGICRHSIQRLTVAPLIPALRQPPNQFTASQPPHEVPLVSLLALILRQEAALPSGLGQLYGVARAEASLYGADALLPVLTPTTEEARESEQEGWK
ncbi:hypothetical protein BBK36DRAFT_1142811 [Trichoderma citrinoviride]|uniref:Uncharacterized protein n=1 Tax=Trichoderma citrinoviride TaxID=58853 RepID=A0A2T4B6D2_9HYPO|nr:hypothetical protein BBK36DRAFT_1142811 [Trichoderma citrinoviride]PTB64884.1 hypothetical protein BBK36DRAFT_1142811 [Trichoderma citrinoviride]